MALADRLVSVFFGRTTPPTSTSIALLNGTVEVDDAGYDRQEVRRGEWRINGTAATASVRFGPFAKAVEFDRVALMFAGDVLRVARLESPARLLANMAYEHELTVSVDDG